MGIGYNQYSIDSINILLLPEAVLTFLVGKSSEELERERIIHLYFSLPESRDKERGTY